MRRRDFLRAGAGAAMIPALSALPSLACAGEKALEASPILTDEPLTPPAKGKIRVAFAIAQNTNVMDLSGPWEVFQDVHVPIAGGSHDARMPFELYTVAESKKVIKATGGLQIVPNYTVHDAPRPHLVVVPASRARAPLHRWLAEVAPETHVTMSVCTGAYQLGRAGLLDGLVATTHHDFYDDFAQEFPNVNLVRGLRFVENKRIATAGGLTSGIDLALRVVERYFGREVARWTADYMEYTGTGWQV